MSPKRIRVLCVPLSAVGHVNPVIGLGTELLKRGHEVTIAADFSWENKFDKLGFKEVLYNEKPLPSSGEKPSGKQWIELIQAMAPGFRMDPYDSIMMVASAFDKMLAGIQYSNEAVGNIIEKVSPDVVIYENLLWHPSVLKSKVPIIKMESSNPLHALHSENLPPSKFGLSIHSDPSVWKRYKDREREAFEPVLAKYLQYISAEEAPPPQPGSMHYISTNLNILLYPRVLIKDYLDKVPNPETYVAIDHALRPTDRDFILPDKLASLPGKLVYLSMGSLGSADVDLMTRLVSILAKSAPRYKFIVSMGLCSEEYELADNMWGQGYVSQLGVLPLVDLAIIHGGNNSFVETLYFGKPMIVIPLFGDQPDNAQCAVDAKIGARFNPFKDPEEKLVQLMDEVLQSQEIATNVSRISKEMQETDSLQRAVDRIEDVARNPKKPFIV